MKAVHKKGLPSPRDHVWKNPDFNERERFLWGNKAGSDAANARGNHVTGEFQSMAIAMRQKKQAADDQRAATASAAKATRQQALREKENALRSLILPTLERAKQEFESESIPSEINQRFEIEEPYVTFRCKGPESWHVPSNTARIPASKMTCTPEMPPLRG